MPFDASAAVKYLDAHKAAGPTGHCAKYVRLAIAAGGIDTAGAPVSAKSYGPFLELKGFEAVEAGEDPEAGDIVVIQPYKGGSPHGHIAMFTGSVWISDFKQNDMWGGPGYRNAKPGTKIYRYKKVAATSSSTSSSTSTSSSSSSSSTSSSSSASPLR